MFIEIKKARYFLFFITATAIIYLVGVYVPNSIYKPYILALIFVAAIVIYRWVIDRIYHSETEKIALQKIETLKKSGQALSHESEQPLSAGDIKKLKTYRNLILFAYLAAIFIFSAVSYFLLMFWDQPGRFYLQVVAIILIISGVGFAGKNWLERFNQQIVSNKKTVVRGIIVDKEVVRDEDSNSYFLKLDNLSVKVNKKVYRKYELGDGIEIHIFKPMNDHFLQEKKLT